MDNPHSARPDGIVRRMDELLPLPADDRLPFGIPFTTAQALAAGVKPNQLSRMVRQGLLRRVFKGAYVDAAAEDTPLLRTQALGLVIPATAVVADESAAWARGVDLLARGDHIIPPPISVVQPLTSTRVRQRDTQGGRRLLTARDIEIVHGVAMTTHLRTGIDIARRRSRPRGLAALDAMMCAGGFSSEELLLEVQRFRGFRGVVKLRELARLADPRAESPAESAMRLLWVKAGLPRPTLQIPILGRLGNLLYRLDMGLPEIRYAAEYDGLAWHSTPEQRARDRARRSWLRREQGWVIDVLGKDEVFTKPERAADIFRDGIARAERRLRGAA